MSFVLLSDENVNEFCKIAKSGTAEGVGSPPPPPSLNPTFCMVKNMLFCLATSITHRNNFIHILYIVNYFMGDILTSQKVLQCFDLPVSIQLILKVFSYKPNSFRQFVVTCRFVAERTIRFSTVK